MAVAAVLIFSELLVRLGRFKGTGQSENDRVLIQRQTNIAFQMNRASAIFAGGKRDRAAAGAATLRDGFINRRGVIGNTIADRAELFHVEFRTFEFWQWKIR